MSTNNYSIQVKGAEDIEKVIQRLKELDQQLQNMWGTDAHVLEMVEKSPKKYYESITAIAKEISHLSNEAKKVYPEMKVMEKSFNQIVPDKAVNNIHDAKSYISELSGVMMDLETQITNSSNVSSIKLDKDSEKLVEIASQYDRLKESMIDFALAWGPDGLEFGGKTGLKGMVEDLGTLKTVIDYIKNSKEDISEATEQGLTGIWTQLRMLLIFYNILNTL